MAENEKTSPTPSSPAQSGNGRGFPDPSLTVVEFGDALGLFLAARTERDSANRRIVLRKVAYVRLEPEAWGVTAFKEIRIEQKDSVFVAVEPASGKYFRDPSRRRYEIVFLSPEIFECAIQSVKERNPGPIHELVLVTLSNRPGFRVEDGVLSAPEDYAAERGTVEQDRLIAPPERVAPGR